MPPKVDTKNQEKQAEEVLKNGLYAALEGDDNAVAVSDENFVGTEEDRKDFAYDIDAPLAGEYEDDENPEKKVFEAAAKREAEMAARGPVSDRTGFSPNLTHPSERKSPQAVHAERQETILEAQAAVAQRELDRLREEEEASNQEEQQEQGGSSDATTL